MAKFSFELRAAENSPPNSPARHMHGKTITLVHLPRKGDFVFDRKRGYAEVVQVVFDTDPGGYTVLVIT